MSCPAGQYMNEGTCENCGENQWSAEGSDECSSCPNGMSIESGPGTSESDCKMGKIIYLCNVHYISILKLYFFDKPSNYHFLKYFHCIQQRRHKIKSLIS